jgi:hypothetical protein
MNTEITVTFPFYVETARAMRLLREALLSHDEACATFAGCLVAMTGPQIEKRTPDSVSLGMAVGAVVFPEEG